MEDRCEFVPVTDEVKKTFLKTLSRLSSPEMVPVSLLIKEVF